jgi:hypothetical protein
MISNIVNMTGNRIRGAYFDRRKVDQFKSNATMKWPHQKRPALDTFRIWKRAIVAITECDGMGMLPITKRLGNWLVDYSKHQHISSAIHKTHSHLALYHYETQIWCIHQLSEESRAYTHFNKRFLSNVPRVELNDYTPVDITEDRNFIFVRSRNLARTIHPFSDIEPNLLHYHNFSNFLLRCSDWTSHIIKDTQILQEPNLDLNDLQIHLCSDGGVRHNTASYGMVLSINGNIISNTAIKLTQEYGSPTSYRSEAFGLLSAVILYNKLQEFSVITTGARKQINPTIYCDNEALVNTINKIKYSTISTKFYYNSDADLIGEILNILKQMRIVNEHATIRHVKGHQDRGTSVLNYDAYLNVQADRLATTALNNTNNMGKFTLPNTTATLWINEERVTSKHTIHLREAFQTKNIIEHMKKSNDWTN